MEWSKQTVPNANSCEGYWYSRTKEKETQLLEAVILNWARYKET